MSDSKDWVAHAERLPEGYTRKIPHACGEGAALQLNHKEGGYSAYCHRCSYRGWHEKAPENLAEKLARIERRRAAERIAQISPSLPMPAVYEPQQWPLAARVWLYRAGVSNTDIESLGIYYCTSLQRVVLPVKNDSGKIVYWQARTLDPTHPRKVLNPKADKSNLVFKEGTGPSVALTEDILSTVKLAKCGVESWALLGTKLSPYTAAKLIESRRPVIVALDSDRAGRSAAEVIIKQLRAYGCETYNVIFGRDPKLVPRDEIYGEFDRQGIKYAV